MNMRLARPAHLRDQKLVVIVGGGFAGLNTARRLANVPGVRVVLIDKRNHHLFQPLLYQVATAGLNAADIAVPIRRQFRHASNVEIHLGKVERVDLQQRIVVGGGHELPYDYLVLACGANHSYFGRPEWEEFAPGLKTLEQATEIRRRILAAFERAENALDPDEQRELMTFVVVGAGPTGVELAGAIADISRTALRGDFRRISPECARVVLIEAGDRVLPSFEAKLSDVAERDLRQLGVEVFTQCRVEGIDSRGVTIASGRLPARSVFWAAGVQAAPMPIEPPVDVDRSGRIKVRDDFSLESHNEVFVVGDMASFVAGSSTLPGVAPAAMQGGRYVADMILRDLRGRPREPFSYRDKGQMATIGRSRAIASTGRMSFTGRMAWLIWLFVHVYYLVGFRNRALVLGQWAWNYLFSRRESRLITDPEWRFSTRS